MSWSLIPGDTFPGNIGVRILEFDGKTLDRLSDNLQIADHGILCFAVGEEGLLPRST